MRRRKGISGAIVSLIIFIIFAGVFLAILKQFDWDLIEMFHWCLSKIAESIERIAEKFEQMPTFRKIFSK